MPISLRTLDRYGQPIFILLAFMTLPLWFPLMFAWMIIDPPYRWAYWQKRGIKSHMKSVGPTHARMELPPQNLDGQ